MGKRGHYYFALTARGSYFTETEFDLSRLFQIRDRIAEVSHLCCHRGYRDRATIDQLWNGLNNYMFSHKHTYLIGCVNLSMDDGGHYAASVYYKIYQQYAASAEYRVFPRCTLPLKTWLCSQIMLLDRFTDRHSQPLLGFRSIAFFTVEGTKPAEIVVQVARGHTAKLLYPGF